MFIIASVTLIDEEKKSFFFLLNKKKMSKKVVRLEKDFLFLLLKYNQFIYFQNITFLLSFSPIT